MMRGFILATALLTLCLFVAPRSAFAYNPYSSVCTNPNAGNSTVCRSPVQKTDPLTGSDGILAHITNIVAFIAGMAAVIIMIVSALRFVTSGSDVSTGSRTDTDIENARRGIASAAIGLFVIILARALILFVLNKVH